MSDILKQICDDKLIEVEARKAKTPIEELFPIIESQTLPRGFLQSLTKFKQENKPALISEVKKKSPSKGLIRENFNPSEIASIYEKSGAACISCLTDEKYFAGTDEYLKEVKQSSKLPVLRKDFMLEPYQIFESRALSADCILLIMAALEDEQAAELEEISHSLGMDVLIEVHDEEELERALKLQSKLIGVNNRNLKTMEVTLETSKRLSKLMDDSYLKVCESGISNNAEILEMMDHGFSAFLVGESLMRQDNISEAVKKLLGN